MIENIVYNPDRDLFSERRKNPYGGGDVLLIASEEFVNRRGNFTATETHENKKGVVEFLFNDTLSQPDFNGQKNFWVNDLLVISFYITEEGGKNIEEYLNILNGKR